MTLKGCHVLLGITGGIAAYKSVVLLRELQKRGAKVRVVMTPSATQFVGVETFRALTRHEVLVDVISEKHNQQEWIEHIQLGKWADIYIIAPCTCNSLAKLVHGISDTMLTTLAYVVQCPIVLCPTMDGGMFHNAVTQSNISKGKALGYTFIMPEKGYLASGIHEVGRLPAMPTILDMMIATLTPIKNKLLTKKRVVITGGATREYIDPVRFISNPSSGKMALALAKAAYMLGAEVTFIHGPIALSIPSYIHNVMVNSTDDMLQEVQKVKDDDIFIMAAAVADYTPQEYVHQKIKKNSTPTSVQLNPTPDILEWLGKHKQNHQTIIGFSLETQNRDAYAIQKCKSKNCDWIVANEITEANPIFNQDYNNVWLYHKDGTSYTISDTKENIALKIMQYCFSKPTSNSSKSSK